MKRIVAASLLTGLLSLGSPWASAKEKEKGVLKIDLSTKGNDISFDREQLEVKFSQELKLKFVNHASKDSQILHNVAILRPGTTDLVVKRLQETAYNLDVIRSDPAVLVMTKSLEPGEEEEISFHPKEPGLYPFICLMPGHGDMLGMRGTLLVKKP